MSIHPEHPFATPAAERRPSRRFRGRLPSPVTLWTAADSAGRAGLTVASVLVADGDPAFAVGVIDELSDLWEVLRRCHRVVITQLDWPDRGLADRFGYVAPAPGGPFAGTEWLDTEWGPVPAHARTWAGGRLVDPTGARLGWGVHVAVELEHIEVLAEPGPALVHRGGRYETVAGQSGQDGM
ncbi:flavin reductase family protein [Jatrophihabitans telluris]|uniref:Flavin reductase family protein n=1 Tax=Jatrophihabitans telluris TaxID=2038343 RepID=A0ABY4R0P0_9ACTN|nr:flavin reductase [Jatrophihabitans telluris]UQX89158.1 flavin reductase family protein [Jatrophihabitans telluris]